MVRLLIGNAIPVSLGRSGLGWGEGLHPAQSSGPVKKEGDGRSPAGIFRMGTAFGYRPLDGKWPYRVLTPDTECVDDAQSKRYNRLVDRSTEKVDWKSSEKMLRSDDLYRIGIVVLHNDQPIPGKGSCIFLHIRATPESATVGCTAMEPNHIETILKWLDPAKRPILVQLPKAEYQRLKKEWELP